jgi:hypothetical protein
MNVGMIDFIEPTEKGEYKREAFEITSDDVTALTAQIKKAAHEIATFSFWNNLCEESDCEYCRLRKLLDH